MEKVIVVITAYNLEKYIGQALESVINQKTNFPFRIIVADDCSTDNTLKILERYAANYPKTIEIWKSNKNLGSLANSNRVFDGIQCEYFSFLDGDDYWLTDNRLQKQIDFLDTHLEYSMCGGNSIYLRNGEFAERMIEDKYLNRSFSFDDFVSGVMPFVHTSSIVVRNSIFVNGLPRVFRDAVGTHEECALRGEDFRRILHLQNGPIYIMNDVFSVYRIHDKGMWQGITSLKRMLECAIRDRFYAKYFDDSYGGFFASLSEASYRCLIEYLMTESILFPRCRLTEGDAYLFTNLILDCSSAPNSVSYSNKYRFKRFLFRGLFAILRKIS